MIPPAIRYLIEAAHQAPSADNSQPWLFAWDGYTLAVRYENTGPGAAVFGRDSHCERLTMGAVIENLVQVADSIDMTGNWDFRRQGDDYLRFAPDKPGMEAALAPEHPAFTRHTNRFSFMPQSIEEETVELLEDMAEADCTIRVYREAKHITTLAGLIRNASSMRFRNRQLHEWFGKSLRFTESEIDQGTGLDVATIELPAGGTALLRLIMDWRRMKMLNHLGMYHLLSGIESQAIKKSPALLAVLGPPDEALAAGRLLERVWLGIDNEHLAAQPYYVLTDQIVRLDNLQLPDALIAEGRSLKRDTAKFLGEDVFPHMLFRIGYSNKPLKRSKRLATSLVVKDESEAQHP